MPITQERMMRVIEAADYYQNRLKLLRQHAERMMQTANRTSDFDILHEIVVSFYELITQRNVEEETAFENFVDERAHFRINAQRNRNTKDAMRRARLRTRTTNQSHLDEQELENAGFVFGPAGVRPPPEPKHAVDIDTNLETPTFNYQGFIRRLHEFLGFDISPLDLLGGAKDFGFDGTNPPALVARLELDNVIEPGTEPGTYRVVDPNPPVNSETGGLLPTDRLIGLKKRAPAMDGK